LWRERVPFAVTETWLEEERAGFERVVTCWERGSAPFGWAGTQFFEGEER
jgi:hypothetical protein